MNPSKSLSTRDLAAKTFPEMVQAVPVVICPGCRKRKLNIAAYHVFCMNCHWAMSRHRMQEIIAENEAKSTSTPI